MYGTKTLIYQHIAVGCTFVFRVIQVAVIDGDPSTCGRSCSHKPSSISLSLYMYIYIYI